MNKSNQIYTNIIVIVAVLFAFSICVAAQTKSRPRVSSSAITMLNGAYAGSRTDIYTSGVSTYIYTYYFRPDGTYTTELDKPDWQTRVDGTYSLKGRKVLLLEKERGQSKEFELKDNGSLNGYPTLVKYNVANTVPARYFETTSANTTGGLGSGVRAYGTISESSLNFDGNGRFCHSNSVLKVRPDSEKTNSRGGGIYTIRNSLLTLNYDDGTINKLSFFYFEENGEVFALIGGNLYWENEVAKKSKTNAVQKEILKTERPQSNPTQALTTNTLNGAYAGTSTPNLNPFNNLSISFDTFAFYFRQNGTYATELDEADWQTRVDGTYRISGNKVFIQSKSVGDKPEEIEIKENGSLYFRYSYLFKLEVANNVPAVVVENKSASGGGGQIQGTVYVGNISNTIYNFDGKGNFSNSRKSATLISGSNIGGGVAGNSGGVGTYTLKNGLLTLTYQDGTVVKKSFFYTEDDGDGTALINGSFYFEPDELNDKTTNSVKKETTTPIKSPTKSAVITTLNGAYAGSSVPVFFPGGGSSSSSYRYYFRPNGTYTTELDEPNWQTRIDGNYKITKGKVTLYPKEVGEKPFEMDIEEEGASLVYGGNTLFKLNVMNNIPAIIVENSGGTSSGGSGTGTTFVGVSFSGVYNFDGKGRFSNNASSSSVISGANVGGGSSNESGGSGTYTIKDSLLTLKYDNGTVVKRSFFYIEFSHGGTALIDGRLYYEPDKAEAKTTVKNKSDEPNEATMTESTTIDKNSTKVADLTITGSRILKLANIAHGGDKLDNLKTIRLTGKALGFEITILVDATNQKVRNEFRKNGKLMLVEQLDGENSWLWGDNLKSPMTFQKRKELKKSLTTGLFALQNNAIKSGDFQTADPNLKGNLKSLLVLVDGEKYGMIFDDKNRLVAELTTEDGVLQTTYSEDYRNISGIMIPFKSKVTLGEKSIEVKFSAVEVNPNFSEKDWAVPN